MKGALAKVDGITDVELKSGSGSFTAPADMDVAAELDKIVEGGNEHMKGWSKVE